MAAGDTKLLWGTAVSLTLTGLNSLASDDGLTDGSVDFWESALLDFTSGGTFGTGPLEDVLVTVQLRSGATVADPKAAYVHVWSGAEDGSGNYVYTDAIAASGPAARSNGRFPTNLPLLGIVNLPAATLTAVGGSWSLAALFGGSLPKRGGLYIRQNTGAALDATIGNFKVFLQPVYRNTAQS
jgi:hypothetical protein